MVNYIQWSGQEATNRAYCSKYSLLAKYPTGLEYFNMEQVLVLHPLICLSYYINYHQIFVNFCLATGDYLSYFKATSKWDSLITSHA